MPRWLSESCQALCAALLPSLNISSKIPAEWASVSCQDPDWYNFSSEIQNSGIKFQKLVWLRAHFEKIFTSSQKNSSYPGLISWCPQQISAVDSRLSTQAKVHGALGWGMCGISGHLCLEPPCFYTSMALITVAAERRYCLIRLILGVGGKERDRCLSLVAVGAVPAWRMMYEWDLWVEPSEEQLSSLLGPRKGKFWPRIWSWGEGPLSQSLWPESLLLSLARASPGRFGMFGASNRTWKHRLRMEMGWAGICSESNQMTEASWQTVGALSQLTEKGKGRGDIHGTNITDKCSLVVSCGPYPNLWGGWWSPYLKLTEVRFREVMWPPQGHTAWIGRPRMVNPHPYLFPLHTSPQIRWLWRWWGPFDKASCSPATDLPGAQCWACGKQQTLQYFPKS